MSGKVTWIKQEMGRKVFPSRRNPATPSKCQSSQSAAQITCSHAHPDTAAHAESGHGVPREQENSPIKQQAAPRAKEASQHWTRRRASRSTQSKVLRGADSQKTGGGFRAKAVTAVKK